MTLIAEGARMALTDEQLLARIVNKDEAAFAELYDRYAPRLLGLLVKLLARRNEAEDVLQETFWQAWSRADQYQASRSSPMVWLLMIARSRARDQLRRSRRQYESPPIGDSTFQEDASAEVDRQETADLTRTALSGLPEEQRGAILLAFYGGLTHVEIANTQAVALGTVKTRIRLGMKRMRAMLPAQRKAAG